MQHYALEIKKKKNQERMRGRNTHEQSVDTNP